MYCSTACVRGLCLQTFMHTRIHTYIHTYILAYIHAYKHTYVQTCIRAHIRDKDGGVEAFLGFELGGLHGQGQRYHQKLEVKVPGHGL